MVGHFLRAGRRRQSEPDRLVGFSDGVFAVAITLVALQFDIPRGLSVDGFVDEFGDELMKLPTYALTFLLVGLFWQVHHRVFEQIPRQDPTLVGLNLTFLGVVCLIPFVSSTYSEYVDAPYEVALRAVVLYAATMVMVGVLMAACWWYASGNRRLVAPTLSDAMIRYERARGMVMPVTFALSIPVAFVTPNWAPLTWMVGFVGFALVNRTLGARVEAEAEAETAG